MRLPVFFIIISVLGCKNINYDVATTFPKKPTDVELIEVIESKVFFGMKVEKLGELLDLYSFNWAAFEDSEKFSTTVNVDSGKVGFIQGTRIVKDSANKRESKAITILVHCSNALVTSFTIEISKPGGF